MKQTACIMSFDAGTSGIKAVLVGVDGTIRASANAGSAGCCFRTGLRGKRLLAQSGVAAAVNGAIAHAFREDVRARKCMTSVALHRGEEMAIRYNDLILKEVVWKGTVSLATCSRSFPC